MKIISPIEAQKIADKGTVMEHWPCDVNEDGEIQPDGADKMLVEFGGKYYEFVGRYDSQTKKVTIYGKVFCGQRQVEITELPEYFVLQIMKKMGKEFKESKSRNRKKK